MQVPWLFRADGYKLDHRRQYPNHTEFVYSNFTPRASRIEAVDSVVFVGLQYFLQKYLMEDIHETFFNRNRGEVCDQYQNMLDNYLGPTAIGTQHISDLHDLGYVPLEFIAFPEGTPVPLRMPFFTVENTEPEFFWITNYIETMISAALWLPSTSATIARRYRRLLDRWAKDTGTDPAFVDWQGHDFSYRGMENTDAAALSGLGHLLSFTGTDTVPSLWVADRYYGATSFVGGSVAATEHSVMCAGGQEDEDGTFDRLLDLYGSGIVSVVSDTWDFWNVLTNILPARRERIMARDGKLVIRPDSGDPIKIVCGDPSAPEGSPQRKGAVQLLWDVFGGTTTETGYRLLDNHVGVIYGDAITYERADAICENLARNGFASGNMVYGIGSFTYQYNTRDTFGMAMKATSAQVDGEERMLSKDPVTDDGTKKSARGRIFIQEHNRLFIMTDGLTRKQWRDMPWNRSAMRRVWQNGHFTPDGFQTWEQLRARLASFN